MKLEGRTFPVRGLDTCIICKSTIIVVPFLRHRRAWSIGGVLDVVKTNNIIIIIIIIIVIVIVIVIIFRSNSGSKSPGAPGPWH